MATTLTAKPKQTQKRQAESYRSILCPVDFSIHSARALRCALTLAARWGSRVTLVYAVDPMVASAAAVALNDEPPARRAEGALHDFLRENSPRGQDDESHVACFSVVGHAAEAIVRMAERTHADLIVMSTHATSGPRRLVVGSTTRAVLQRSAVPVLAIPLHDDTAMKLDEAWPRRIVAALDLDSHASRVAAAAAEVARRFGVPLILVHVVDRMSGPKALQEELGAHDRLRIAKAQTVLDTLAMEISSICPAVETRVVCGEPADELAVLVCEERVGLVVTALAKGTGLFGSRRGSISYHVLAHGAAPVLALPRP